jgi:hypothetical protein
MSDSMYISLLHTGRWSGYQLRSLAPLCDFGGPQTATEEAEITRDIPLRIQTAIVNVLLYYEP